MKKFIGLSIQVFGVCAGMYAFYGFGGHWYILGAVVGWFVSVFFGALIVGGLAIRRLLREEDTP